MRNVKVNTYPENNKPNTIEIDNLGTMTFIGFAQVLYNANLIDYKTYRKCSKIVLSENVCSDFVNSNEALFPINF
jgi:hypothetical protein